MQSQRRAGLQNWQVCVVLGIWVLVGAVGGFWLGVGASAWYAPGIIAPCPGNLLEFRVTPPPTKAPRVGTLI